MGTALVALGNKIWNWVMGLVVNNLSTSPANFSGDAWYAAGTAAVYYVLPIALALLNVFLIVGFLQNTANIKQQLTLEIFVEACVRFVFANAIVVFSWDIISYVFELGTYLVFPANALYLDDSWIGNLSLGNELLGIVYFLVAGIGAFMILITVWGRFLQLYLLAATAPAAFATMAGTGGISQTAWAYIRTVIGKVAEILIISLALAIGAAIASSFGLSIDQMSAEELSEYINTLGTGTIMDTVKQMGMIVVTAAAVKGADTFLKRALNL